MDLTPTHLHLLLNHFPTIGFIIGFGLFVVSLVAKSDHLKVASLVVLVGISLVTIPAYTTGNAAQVRICAAAESGLPGPCEEEGVSRVLMDMHEGAAFMAMVFMTFTGGLAWLGLWYHRRFKAMPVWNTSRHELANDQNTAGTCARIAWLSGRGVPCSAAWSRAACNSGSASSSTGK